MVVAAIGVFVYMNNEDRTNAKRQAAIAVHGRIDFSDALVLVPPVKPAPTVRVPLTNGTVLQVRRCASPVKDDRMLDAFDQIAAGYTADCRTFSSDPLDIRATVPLGNPDQIAIEKDYWTAYKNSRHQRPVEEMLGPLLFGLCGFPAGLVLWIFYRLARFAVKG